LIRLFDIVKPRQGGACISNVLHDARARLAAAQLNAIGVDQKFPVKFPVTREFRDAINSSSVQADLLCRSKDWRGER
jgi:hypothetical protein